MRPKEFRLRRMVKAAWAGDIKTAAELAEKPTELQMVVLGLLMQNELGRIAKRLLKSQRTRALVSNVYEQTLDPTGLDSGPTESVIETLTEHLLSGEVSRIGRMAERVAATGTSDCRAARLLAGRLERIHGIVRAGMILEAAPGFSGEIEIVPRSFDELQDDYYYLERQPSSRDTCPAREQAAPTPEPHKNETRTRPSITLAGPTRKELQ